jgi:hypothetical protein
MPTPDFKVTAHFFSRFLSLDPLRDEGFTDDLSFDEWLQFLLNWL